MRHGELSVVVQVEQDGQRRQSVVAGGKLHDDAVGLHAALPDALPEAVAVCAERLAAVGVVGQQRFGRFEDGRQRFGPPVRPCGEDSRHGGAGVGEAYLPSAGAAQRIEQDTFAFGRSAPQILFDLHYSTGLRFASRASMRRSVSSLPMNDVTSYMPGPLPAPTSASRSVFMICPMG